MGRGGGFSPVDITRLLDLVEQRLPRGQQDWKDLAEAYNLGQGRKHQREPDKLRGKFQRLRNTGDERAQAAHACIDARSQVVEAGGSPTNNDLLENEQLVLRSIIEEQMPTGGPAWVEVERECNDRRPEGTLARTAEDLMRCFTKLCRVAKPTGDADCPEPVRRAKRVKVLPQAELGANDDAESEDNTPVDWPASVTGDLSDEDTDEAQDAAGGEDRVQEEQQDARDTSASKPASRTSSRSASVGATSTVATASRSAASKRTATATAKAQGATPARQTGIGLPEAQGLAVASVITPVSSAARTRTQISSTLAKISAEKPTDLTQLWILQMTEERARREAEWKEEKERREWERQEQQRQREEDLRREERLRDERRRERAHERQMQMELIAMLFGRQSSSSQPSTSQPPTSQPSPSSNESTAPESTSP